MDARQQWQHQENQRFDRLLPQVNQAQANHPLEAHTQRQEVIDLVHPGYGSDTVSATPELEMKASIRGSIQIAQVSY